MNEWMSKLERAKALFDAGALTQEEFEAEKARLLPQGAVPAVWQEVHAEPEAAAAPERAFGYRTVAGKVAIAAVAVIAIGSGIYFMIDKSPFGPATSEGVRETPGHGNSAAKEAIPSPVPATIQSKSSPIAIADQCRNGELKIRLPGVGSTGSIVLNYPLDDTDGRGSLSFDARSFICVTPAQLARFATPGSNDLMSSNVSVTYDPSGRRRSSLDYSVLFCSELPDTPNPPKSLKIGDFRWRGQSVAPEVSVRWYADFRKHIEADCFCDNGSTAPCTTESPRE